MALNLNSDYFLPVGLRIFVVGISHDMTNKAVLQRNLFVITSHLLNKEELIKTK